MKLRAPIPHGPHLVVGLARSGVAAALALRARKEEVIGVDRGAPAGAQQLASAGVELHLGREGVELLERVRVLIKSPGVPAGAPVIAAARARGMPVLGELELAWRMLENEFIAVTGTNGKTTTVEMIGHVHRTAGRPVAVAGNVGTALSSLAGSLQRGATIVCEASSFQLEDTSSFAPEGAVLLNLAEDHLDRHGTMGSYIEAKLEIFARQDEGDVAVAPAALLAQLAERRPAGPVSMKDGRMQVGRARTVTFGDEDAAALSLRAGRLWWDERALMALGELRVRGRHNVLNAMAAAAVCLARGVESRAVREGLASFAGVEHRLEEVARRAGVLYVNDSKATNVASTLVALQAFAQRQEDILAAGEAPAPAPAQAGEAHISRGRRVHLILGGQGKGQDFSALRDALDGCRAVYLIGEDAGSIKAALEGIEAPVIECGQLQRALACAQGRASAGEVVLLSPGCASFDQFDDFEARGERFRELVLAASR